MTRVHPVLAVLALLTQTASANIAPTSCNTAASALQVISRIQALRPDAQRLAWSRIAEQLTLLRLAQSEIEELRYQFARDTTETLQGIEVLTRNEMTTECNSYD